MPEQPDEDKIIKMLHAKVMAEEDQILSSLVKFKAEDLIAAYDRATELVKSNNFARLLLTLGISKVISAKAERITTKEPPDPNP